MPKAPKYVLAIETATRSGSISLLIDGGEASSWVCSDEKQMSADLLPQIEVLLSSNSISISDINLIVVCSGPGSFTGVRVGLAAAKGFQGALDIPAVAVTLTEALAASVGEASGDVIAVVPSGRDEIYWQRFGAKQSDIVCERLDESSFSSDNAIMVTTTDLKPENLSQIESREGKRVEVANPNLAAHVAAVAMGEFTKGRKDNSLAPVYVKEFAIGM